METRSLVERLQGTIVFTSAIGYIVSLLLHVLNHLHVVQHAGQDPGPYFFVVFLGIFVVWFPTVFYMQRFNREMRGGFGFRGWKYVLAGAPRWLVWVAGISFAYAIANFFLIAPGSQRDGAHPSTSFELIGSGHAMAFYAAAVVINYAAMKRRERGIDWQCERGHSLAPSDKFCSECGAPAKTREQGSAFA